MAIICPSLLACDFLNIERELKAFEKMQDLWFHLDIMDGHFVPNLTFGHPLIELISKKTNIPLDAHLMVANPEFYIETLKDFKLKNFTFHIEAANSLELIEKAKTYYPSVGLSIKPKTPIEKISDQMLKALDLVLVMSVEPGFGGQKFMPESLEKITGLAQRAKALNTPLQIQVDGGISDQNAKELICAGATHLVAGSYVFKMGPKQYQARIDRIR